MGDPAYVDIFAEIPARTATKCGEDTNTDTDTDAHTDIGADTDTYTDTPYTDTHTEAEPREDKPKTLDIFAPKPFTMVWATARAIRAQIADVPEHWLYAFAANHRGSVRKFAAARNGKLLFRVQDVLDAIEAREGMAT